MKKRFLALFLILVMCMSLALVGCGDSEDKDTTNAAGNKVDDGNDIVEQPLTLDLAINNTVNALCGSDHSIPVLESFDEKKVITIEVADTVSNVLNLDAKNLSFYDELTVSAEGETVNMNFYCDGKDLAVTAPGMANGDQAIGLSFETFMEDMESSGTMAVLEEGMADIMPQLKELLAQVEDLSAATQSGADAAAQLLTDIEGALSDVEKTEETKNVSINGKDVSAVVYTYKLDNDDFKKLMNVYIDFMEGYADSIMALASPYIVVQTSVLDSSATDSMASAESSSAADSMDMSAAFDELRTELDAVFEQITLDTTISFAVNPNNRCVMQMDTEMNMVMEGENITMDMALILGEDPAASDKYVLTMTGLEDNTEMLNAELAFETKTSGSVESTAVTFTATSEGESLTAGYTATFDSTTKAYELKLDAMGETLCTANGKMENTDDKFLLALDSITADGETLDLGVVLSVENDPNCEIPAVPEYTNIVKEGMIKQLLESIF